MTSPLIPRTDDHDTAGFFASAAKGELAICVCGQCGRTLHLPRRYCSGCGATDPQWTPTSGRGRIYSWTVVHHQVHPAFPAPYTILLIELEDHADVRLVGYLAGTPDVRPNQSVTAWFENLEDGTVLPQWALSDPALQH